MVEPREACKMMRCPECTAGPLQWDEKEKGLYCRSCKQVFPYEKNVFSFLQGSHYTASFGFQWQRHAHTQLDKFNGLEISRERFFRQTRWEAAELRGHTLLEVGSGAGRFTQIVLDAGATVFSLEASDAAYVNAENNAHPRLCMLKASLYDMPLADDEFDFLLSLGVLQHTPDVEKAFKALFRPLKRGGRFCLDVYAAPIAYLHPRHLFRPWTRRMNDEKLYHAVEKSVERLLPISSALHRIPLCGEWLARLVPVANWRKNLSLKSEEQYFEWAVLDTFDWYSARYEKPQWSYRLKRWGRELGLAHFEIRRERGLYVLSGVK